MKIDGKLIAKQIYSRLRLRVEKLQQKGVTPHIAVILVGENPASEAYVLQKQKHGEAIDAKVTVLQYGEKVTTEELAEKIRELNEDPSVHGILLQRPLPQSIDVQKLVLLTDPQKDIDGFHPDSPFILPLPLAVSKILEIIYDENNASRDLSSWLRAKTIIVLGKGETGGKPIIAFLHSFGTSPVVVDSKTENPDDVIKTGDIVISAVGKRGVITKDNLKRGAILIGVGLFKDSEGKLQGDYDEAEIKDIASYYTPTPGGVGPVNVAMLLENLITAAEKVIKE